MQIFACLVVQTLADSLELATKINSLWSLCAQLFPVALAAITSPHPLHPPLYLMLLLLFVIVPLIVAASPVQGSSQNLTCRSQPRAACFMGTCPGGFTCLSNDLCCDNNDVIKPAGECSDFLEGCDAINCEHRDFYEFARANCAKTCNFCNDKPLAPEYNCNDLLDDCKNRTHLCLDRDFQSSMALFCPRSCSLCAFNENVTCGDSLPDCATRGSNFCDSVKTSNYQLHVGCGKTCKAC